jgi:hypothetical protein
VARDVLLMAAMQRNRLSLINRVISLAAIALICIVPSARAQMKETITAVAEVKTEGGAVASAPVTLVIERFATDEEQRALIAAVKKNGTEAARQLLMKRDKAGTLQLGTRTTVIQYAFVRALGSGRLITAITTEPILFLGAGVPDAKPTAGYPLGLALIEVPGSGAGRGELVPAARIRVDENEAIVTEAYNAANTIRLERVEKK